MLRVKKLLPAIALAISLTPFAAQAKTPPQPAHGDHQTVVVQSGTNYFRDSFSG